MKHLFSPWRMKYIRANQKSEGCVFCQAVAAPQDSAENLIVHRGKHCFVILNRFPYTSGHLMVLPYEHLPQLTDVNEATRAEMMELTSTCTEVLQAVYNAQGYNVGANLGAAAGAGIEAHLHMHIVPRWNGDTNFMTAVGNTRVLPEDLTESYSQILAEWQKRK